MIFWSFLACLSDSTVSANPPPRSTVNKQHAPESAAASQSTPQPAEKEGTTSPFPRDGLVTTPLFTKSSCEKRFLTCTKNGIWHGPEHQSRIAELSSQRKQQMTNVTWKAGCPVLMTDLQAVHFTHWQLDGSIRWGEVIVARKVAAGVQEIFAQLYAIGYPITSAKPMLYFNGKDDESMAANNTSAFNCRRVKGSKRYSQHSTGEAIDLNPLWNPWVKGTRVDPPTAREFANRELDHPGLIKPNDQIVSLFSEHGWKWGGYWRTTKDYQHFSTSGY